jgi:hypothetical protein
MSRSRDNKNLRKLTPLYRQVWEIPRSDR